VQGLGGGCVYGTVPGIVTLSATPATRGRALGFLNAGIGLGFSAGPLLAGLLVGVFGWRSIFLLRLPLALGALAWALCALPGAAAGEPRGSDHVAGHRGPRAAGGGLRCRALPGDEHGADHGRLRHRSAGRGRRLRVSLAHAWGRRRCPRPRPALRGAPRGGGP